MKTILEIGGEGGSIKRVELNGKFQYSTNEAAAHDMLDEADQLGIKAILAAKPLETFDTFNLAMDKLIKKYPVFSLYPQFVHLEYKQQVLHYYNINLQ